MRIPPNLKTASMPIILCLAFFAMDAHAAIDNAGVMDNVLDRYSTAASGWAGVVTSAATWLFWTLVLISMVWTFGMMALRKADIGEFFQERQHFSRKLKWDPSDFSSEKFAGGYCLRRPAFVLLQPRRTTSASPRCVPLGLRK